MDKTMKGSTFLIIAHRISTIKDSDVICVFKDGKIVVKNGTRSIAKKYVTVSVFIAAKMNAKYMLHPILR